MQDFLKDIVKGYNSMSVFKNCMINTVHEDCIRLQFGKDLLNAIAASVDEPFCLLEILYALFVRNGLIKKYGKDAVNLCEVLTGRKKNINFSLDIYVMNVQLLDNCEKCLKEMQEKKYVII